MHCPYQTTRLHPSDHPLFQLLHLIYPTCLHSVGYLESSLHPSSSSFFHFHWKHFISGHRLSVPLLLPQHPAFSLSNPLWSNCFSKTKPQSWLYPDCPKANTLLVFICSVTNIKTLQHVLQILIPTKSRRFLSHHSLPFPASVLRHIKVPSAPEMDYTSSCFRSFAFVGPSAWNQQSRLTLAPQFCLNKYKKSLEKALVTPLFNVPIRSMVCL